MAIPGKNGPDCTRPGAIRAIKMYSKPPLEAGAVRVAQSNWQRGAVLSARIFAKLLFDQFVEVDVNASYNPVVVISLAAIQNGKLELESRFF